MEFLTIGFVVVVFVWSLTIHCLVKLVFSRSDIALMVGQFIKSASCEKLKELICLGGLPCNRVMSVWLLVKLSSFDQKVT